MKGFQRVEFILNLFFKGLNFLFKVFVLDFKQSTGTELIDFFKVLGS